MSKRVAIVAVVLIMVSATTTIHAEVIRCSTAHPASSYAPNEGRFFNNFGDSGRSVRFTEDGKVLIRGGLLNAKTKGVESRFAGNVFRPSLTQELTYQHNDRTGTLRIKIGRTTRSLELPNSSSISEIKSIRRHEGSILIVVLYTSGLTRAFVFSGNTMQARTEVKSPEEGAELQDVKIASGQIFLWTTNYARNFENKIQRISIDGAPVAEPMVLNGRIQDFAVSEELVFIASDFDGVRVFKRAGQLAEIVDSIPALKFVSSVDYHAGYIVYSDYSKPDSSSRIFLKKVSSN